MVEGCNAVSVMILFVFVFAFYKGKKLVFVILGLILLYIMNVLRIVGLNIDSDYKEYGKTFHDYIFPAVIYGT
jgi:exosortase family protein XrtF